MLVLKGVCEADAAAADAVRGRVFADVLEAPRDAADPYRPAGEPAGYDPNAPLPPGAPLRRHLVKLLCASNDRLKRACGDCLLAACGGDAAELVRLAGLGSAAGLLQERDLFAGFQHMTA